MNTFKAELVKTIENELQTSKDTLTVSLDMMKSLPKYMSEAVAGGDYEMRRAYEGEARNIMYVISGLTHAAWSKFFSEHHAHHLIIDREESCKRPYMFADSYKRTFYSGVKELVAFNQENAEDFYNAHLLVNVEKTSKWLGEVLDRTGKDYKSCNKEFKTKMTLRNLDSYGHVGRELARALFAVCKLMNIEFSFDKYYTELRNNRVIDGEKFKVIDELDITFEKHQNGNTTLRIGKELVEQLNKLI